jgi:hypothetical protein
MTIDTTTEKKAITQSTSTILHNRWGRYIPEKKTTADWSTTGSRETIHSLGKTSNCKKVHWEPY